MAITRRTPIAKEEEEEQAPTPFPPSPPPPPPPVDVAENDSNSNNNNNNEQQQQQQQQQQQDSANEAVLTYEQTREQRIKENRERLQKLGIADLSFQLKSIVSTKRTPRAHVDRKTPLKLPSSCSTDSRRRSSRLQNAPAVTYTEPKEEKSRRTRDFVLEEGSKPEFYTEEHEKLLGNTEMPWTFGVDGYGANGTRIYDSFTGKTCHQCRQKTLGLRTKCCKCGLVQGQFCGDCLYARYGEHVVEANQNPDWVCPPCRGICNCSLCRNAKGWAPTGPIYRRVSNLGFKSVAHYLIATKRAPPESEKSSDAPQPAKRCLPFEGMELPDDNGSDDKAVVVRTENDPQSESRAVTVGGSGPKSASVGRPRKKSKEENIDGGEELVRVNGSAENGSVPNMNASKPARVGRPRKRSTTENIDGGEELVRVNGSAENGSVPNMNASKSARVGRPRKRSTTENSDGGAESLRVNGSSENGPVSDMNASKSAGVGRPRKRPKKENIDGGEESVGANGSAENGPVSDMNASKLEGVGSPRKRSKKEDIDGGDESLGVNGSAENGPVSDMNASKLEGVGSPRKRSKKEDIDGGDASLGLSGSAENGTISNMSASNTSTSIGNESNSKLAIRRSTRNSKKENVDLGEDSVKTSGAPGEPVSSMKDPNSSDSLAGSISRMLRPRN